MAAAWQRSIGPAKPSTSLSVKSILVESKREEKNWRKEIPDCAQNRKTVSDVINCHVIIFVSVLLKSTF